jgi:transcriptional regulator with XRE-family HTH domain
MTHVQELFTENLRFWRKKKRISQLKLSEMVNLSPNYLNAVENGKNFPSPEVIQHLSDCLEILPYQLFLEYPTENPEGMAALPVNTVVSELIGIEQRLVKEINELIQKYR